MTFARIIGGFVLSGAFLVSGTASATTVPATAGPWDPKLNAEFDYGLGDNTAPIAVGVNPGDNLTITYVGGQTKPWSGALDADANGYVLYYGVGFAKTPSYYLDPKNADAPVYLNQLMGSFVNSAGGVLKVFAIGNGPLSITAPSSTAFLLLGLNDEAFGDNTGFLNVDVAGSTALSTPLPAALPLFVTGLGVLGALVWRRRRKSTMSQ